MTINQKIKNSMQIGSWVKNIITQDEGIIVMMKNKSAVMCIKENNKFKYFGVIYKDIKILNKTKNIKHIISQIISDVWIEIDDKKFKVVKVNDQSIVGMTPDDKLWTIPIYRILEITIL
jgi:hypothetical protein